MSRARNLFAALTARAPAPVRANATFAGSAYPVLSRQPQIPAVPTPPPVFAPRVGDALRGSAGLWSRQACAVLRREERGFAKKKGKAGGDEGSDVAEIDVGGLLQVTEEQMMKVAVAEEQMMKVAVSAMDDELDKLRTGRADPRILDKVKVKAHAAMVSLVQVAQQKVKAHAAMVSLVQVAQISSPDPKTLQISVFDPDLVGAHKAVEKAIRAADLDLNPQVAGSMIKVPIPRLNQETRQKMVKNAGFITENGKTCQKMVKNAGFIFENGKVVARRIRQKYFSDFKKLKPTQDVAKKFEKDLQTVMDKVTKIIDEALKKKTTELTAA
ncbi:ribosome recycling factor-domain-containing protein [Baffinella frigidus]|nr:ribosome recycling factor-domain-containing protein [Cryptophyta sp. CCMP2293]